MANNDINVNRPTPSSVQGAPPPDDMSVPPPQANPPRVDAGGSGGDKDGSNAGDSGPILALPKIVPAGVLTKLLLATEEKVSATRMANAKERVDEQTQDAQDADKKRIDDLKKMIAAKKKAKHHSKLGKIFGWIGVALTYVAAVVVTVATGGAAAAPLFAAAILMTGLMVAQETGGMDKLAKAMHLDKKGEMGLMIGLTAAILVVSLVSVVASGGAAAVSMVSSIASAVSEFSAAGAEVGAGAAETAAAGAEIGSTAAEVTADSTEIAAEGTEIGADTGEIGSAAADAGADSAEVGADTGADSAEVSEASEGTSQATEEASESDAEEDIAQNSASKTQKVAARVGNVVNVTSAGASVGSGVSGIQTAEDEHDAATAEANATDQEAFLAQIQAIQAQTIRKLKKILEDMQANTKTIFSIVSSSNQLTEEITKGASA